MPSQISPINYHSKVRRLTAFILLFIQLFLPFSVVFSAVVHAAASPSSLPSGMTGEKAFPMVPLSLPAPPDNTPRRGDISGTLPALDLPDTPDENQVSQEIQVAQGVSEAGRILSGGNVTEASAGYARGIGEDLINRKITDWLEQYGKARIQLHTDKTGDADLLLPLMDKTDRLVFGQVGFRANEDRKTTNIGLGYRQYQTGWVWGLNSFYDYDLTGGNSRAGVGTELWFDYLKFSGNGYFRLTDWHPSGLYKTRDYDERPANGFDLRAEGYLPGYPQLGAFAKYEHYFGNGISLSDSGISVSDLKNNPSRSTLGVSYTPFPLITVKGEKSRGNSNDSRLGLELTYRFGVPLNQQLNPEYVDVMRSLAGGRYDFVERNYNIVMQYRKQELLRISLPDSVTAEEGTLLSVTATVNKSKYSLKSITWTAPELIAQGGLIQVISPVTVNLTLPADIFLSRANKPQRYRVSAVGTDDEGNMSNTAVMWVNVVPGKPKIPRVSRVTLTDA
ncbi:hypothetical protein FAP59_18965, partial [Morganella morganii]|nr:hypothetical protein [Morganella morganii]